MEKEQNENVKDKNAAPDEENHSAQSQNEIEDSKDVNDEGDKKELTPEEKILQLEDKLTRAFAEMENQRRMFEKEKEDAFEYVAFLLLKKH